MASIKGQKANNAAPMRVDGTNVTVTDKVVLGASPGQGTPASSDTIDFRLSAGSLLSSLRFVYDDCDTGTALLYGVGYRAVDPASTLVASTTYFAASGQTGARSAGELACSFKPIKFEEDVYVQIVIGTAMAGVSGNPEIHMIATVTQVGVK